MKKKLLLVLIPVLLCWCFINFACEQTVSVSPETPVPSRRTLYISSLPSGATIFVNGHNMGQVTPDSIVWIASDSNKISLRLMLYRDSLFSVVTPADTAIEIFVDFTKNPRMRGMIYSESYPSKAAIFINDSSVNLTTPAYVKNMLPGLYNVRYKLKGYWDLATTALIKSDQAVIHNVVLEDTLTWITYLPENSSIPEYSFNNLYIDSHGIKWLAGTSTGLTRFDGTNWKTYSKNNSNIPSDYITCIYEDESNKLWIGTDRGLALFDGSSFTIFNAANSPLPSDTITTLRYWGGRGMWIGTTRGLVANNGGIWRKYTEQPIVTQHIRSLAFSPDNILFVGTNMGLWGLQGTSWKPVKGFSGTQVSTLTMLSSGSCYVGLDGYLPNLYKSLMLKKRPIPTTFTQDPSPVGSAFYKIAINQVLVLPEGEVWVATDMGVSRFTNPIFMKWYTMNEKKLKSNFIKAVYRDQDKYFWMATYGGGLVKYKGK